MASAPPLDENERVVTQLDLPIVEGLTMVPGSIIDMTGRVLKKDECGQTRFNINLCCGLLINGDHRDNVALHINPRFDEPNGWFSGEPDRQAVINSLINNEWGAEERHRNPLTAGEYFSLQIRAFTNYYKIAINDRHVCDFEHRVPLENIRCIFIDGCVKIESLSIPKRSPTLSFSIENRIVRY